MFLTISSIPFNIAYAFPDSIGSADMFEAVTAEIGGAFVGLPIGEKGVSFNLSGIKMDIGNAFQLTSQNLLGGIRVFANGVLDETHKFNITYNSGVLRLKLKNSPPDYTYMHPYRLIEHALYNIYIPEGTFKNADGTKINAAVNYTFVTDTDDEVDYTDDILVKVSPCNGQTFVDNKIGKVVFEFVDDIILAEGVSNNIASYIEISSEPFDSSIPGYNIGPSYSSSDSISNYNISVEGNKLIIQAKGGVFKDFAKYTVRLKDGTVYLKESPTRIYNGASDSSGWVSVRFETNSMIESTSPQNNQEGVELEPTIEFRFKYPVDFVDPDRFVITAEDTEFSLVPALSEDRRILKITIVNMNGGTFPLRRSTLYKITMRRGAVELRDYKDYSADPMGRPIENEEASIYFITTGDGESPVVTGYSSDALKTDDITSLESTRLDSDGNIYIHFDRPIRQDKLQENITSLTSATNMYKIPMASSVAYDPSGKIFDEEVMFYSQVFDAAVYEDVYKVMPVTLLDPDEPGDIEDEAYLEAVALEKVEIVQPNMIKITPSFPLDNLNKYKVCIDRELIEGLNGCNIEKSIEFTFWTRAAGTALVPSWEGVSETNAQRIVENETSPYKSYTLYGVPKYGEFYSIVLNINCEVIVKAQDEVIEERPKKKSYITFDALENISLTDAYNPNTSGRRLGFSSYLLKYYFDNGIKKTKLYLYPERDLEHGKSYKLEIPSGVFETRSGNDLGRIEVNFTVKGDRAETRGVYSLENYQLKAVDLADTGEWTFSIRGYNFNEDIGKITLTPTSGNAVLLDPVQGIIEISNGDIFFKDVTKIDVKLRDDVARKLSQESRTGTYRVTLYFNDQPGIGYASPAGLVVLPKGRPEVIDRYPYSSVSGVWFDENSLNPVTIDGVKRFFLKVTFRDPDGTLDFNSSSGLSVLRDSSRVYAQGSGASMIDSDFLSRIINLDTATRERYIEQYIFNRNTAKREAYLYIPVKFMRPQTTYNVVIMPEVVYYSDMETSEGSNEMITWNFTTMAAPVVNAVSLGSITEDYDEDEPIILEGELFYSSSVSVYFNSEEAERVSVETGTDGKKYLEVYLPGGKDRLKSGIYNIIVQNDSNHKWIIYGSLSVVKAGERIPNEKSRLKAEDQKGEVVSDLKVSEDTIELKSKYNDDRFIKLDLDKLMGEDVLVRKIKIEGSRRKEIGVLEAESKWCDIVIYGLTLSPGADDNEMTVSIGRAEPVLSQALKAKLKGKALKSDFIQVSGYNFEMEGLSLSIPFKNSNGRYIRVMRYDEELRNWRDEKFSTNLVDMRVEVESDKPGIFVVVE